MATAGHIDGLTDAAVAAIPAATVGAVAPATVAALTGAPARRYVLLGETTHTALFEKMKQAQDTGLASMIAVFLVDPLLALLAALVAARGWVLPFIASRRR